MKRGNIWGLLFLVIAFFTVWAVVSQSKSFSFQQFQDMLFGASAGWMIAAVVSMLGFIVFEGLAILCIIKALGYRRSLGRGFLYSAADIYFSAITPSATGGQPASAYFMMRDNIPGAVVTISLVANMIAYTLAMLAVGTVGFVMNPEIFFHFHLPGRVLIAVGYIILWGLAVIFYLLISKPYILEKICGFFLKLGRKLHLIKHEERMREGLCRAMDEYQRCSDIMACNRHLFAKAFFFDLLQRVSQITVTLLVYFAIGGDTGMAMDIWLTQNLVTVGTYSIPIPGGMGVADYLMIDGFQAYFDEASAVNLELISRGVAFYVCMIVSAITVLAGLAYTMKKRKQE